MKYYLPLCKKLILILFFSLTFSALYAQDWNQVIKMVASDRSDKVTSGRSVNDEFGNAVAISGDYAVVGSRFADEDSIGKNYVRDAGAAFVFRKVGDKWQKVKKLSPSKRSFENNFGYAVAIQGDYIIVGAHRETEGQYNTAGAVYIFEKNAGGYDHWGEVKRLVAPGRHEGNGDGFGISVSVSNDYLLVGAPGENYDGSDSNPLNDSGAAYLFKKNLGGSNNWGFLKKIVAPNRPDRASFGYSVSINNDYLVVGAPSENVAVDITMYQAGAAYLYNKFSGGEDNWGIFKKLEPTTRVAGASFGYSVSLDGDFTLIGAYKEHIYSNTGALLMAGAAYIFERNWGATNNWGQVRRLGPEYPAFNEFGRFVSLKGQIAVVGAFAEELTSASPRAGSVFVFDRDLNYYNNWGLRAKIVSPIRNAEDSFGASVAVQGDDILVGAIGESEDGDEKLYVKSAGAVYSFLKNQGGVDSWGYNQKITASTGVLSAQYGNAVAISGNFAIVGATGEGKDSLGRLTIDYAGAAYILYNDNGNWKQIRKIVAPDRQSRDNFGSGVAISGEYAVVSTIWQNSGAGAAYVFKKDKGGLNNWGLVKKITASVLTKDDWFGISVAISGDNLIVGAFGDDEDELEGNKLNASGAAYIFNRNLGGEDNWGLVRKITSRDRAANDIFGAAVALSGDYAIIAAMGHDLDENGLNYIEGSGAVYIFKKDQDGPGKWGQLKKNVADNRTAYGNYGRAIAIDGDNAIVSASGATPDFKGAVYVYSKNSGSADNWGLEKKVEGGGARFDSDTQQTVIENFGTFVSLSNNNAVVSGNSSVVNNFNTIPVGKFAYVLSKNNGGANNWGVSKKIEFEVSNPENGNAHPVSISGKYILAGAYQDDTDALGDDLIPSSGAVYIYLNSENPLPVTLTAFGVIRQENSAFLNWTTTFETNSDYFEIQKSRDGRNWNSIGAISASQESDKTKTYSYADKSPFFGENLYRLKMVDRDGTFAYSRIRSLTFGSESQIEVYPNPVTERLFVKLQAGEIDFITVTNSTGQIVSKYKKMPGEGINLDHLMVGTYIIKVFKTDGSVSSKKVIVAR